MWISRLTLQNFRNIGSLSLLPCPGVNIVYGDNAQGKTNLIEAIWLLTGAKSFRGARDSELIRLESEGERSFIEAGFYAEEREQSLRLDFVPQKKAWANEIALQSTGKLAGRLYVVVFSPTHLSLIKDGPQERRDFLDGTICQLKPQYSRVLSDYARVLFQRNSLLKDIPRHPYLTDTLDIWDSHLTRLTDIIIRTRHSYLEKLAPVAEKIYSGISEGREQLTLLYQSRVTQNPDAPDLNDQVAQAIRGAREEDIRAGITTLGAHRDDVGILIDGRSARAFASQGQQRSAVLALKLAECTRIRQVAEEEPVVLLDDVMSELDSGRREYLLNSLAGRQIFITCCDKGLFSQVESGRSFWIADGTMKEQQTIETPRGG